MKSTADDPITALHIELRKKGFDHAIDIYQDKKKKDPGFLPVEADLNDWGYVC